MLFCGQRCYRIRDFLCSVTASLISICLFLHLNIRSHVENCFVTLLTLFTTFQCRLIVPRSVPTVTRRPGVCFKSQLISRPEDSWIWMLVTLTVINLRVLSSWLSTCRCTGGERDPLWSFVTVFTWLPSTWVWMGNTEGSWRERESQVWKIRASKWCWVK